MTYKFLIIGFGNIGKRYFEGILSSKLKFRIYIYDLNKNQYFKDNKKNVFYLKSLKVLPKKFDFIFFTSSSENRFSSINKVISKTKTNYLLIEKILAQSILELKKIKNLLKKKKMLSKTWVNTHYRTYSIFEKTFKNEIKKNTLISVHGNNWGMACNAIHYIDLYSKIFNSPFKKIDTNLLYKKWFKSKRAAFYEIFGKLKIIYKNNKILNLVCKNSGNKSLTIHTIKNEKKTIDIFEEKEELKINGKLIRKFKLDPVSIKIKHIIYELIKYKKTSITPVYISIEQHLILIKSLVSFWNFVHKKKNKKIKIT